MERLLIFCFFLSTTLHAQDVFSSYATHSEVTHVNITPQMFQFLGKFKVNTTDPESEAFLDMIQSLRRFRIMSTQNDTVSEAMETWLKAEISQTPLTSVLNITEKGIHVQFAAIFGEAKNKVKRLVMFVEGLQEHIDNSPSIQLETQTRFDYMLMEIEGDIDLNQVAMITQLVDVPSGEYLEALKD